MEVERVLLVDKPCRDCEFSGMVYALPGGRRDCAVRLLLRICRRTGTLRGMEPAQLMKNSISFYRSRSAILRTVHEPISHWCTSKLEGRLTKERLRLRFTSSSPGWGFPGCCQGLDEQLNYLCI